MSVVTPDGAAWVFGYGSLLWNPGFPWHERAVATLTGYRRAFCRYSLRHRGTPERPGLVIGLREQPGAQCTGLAYLPEEASRPAAMAYLDGREGAGYRRHLFSVAQRPTLERPQGGSLPAWVYVPDPTHPSYFGEQDPARIVELIAQGQGESGSAYDYLVQLLKELEMLNVAEPELRATLAAVNAYFAQQWRSA